MSEERDNSTEGVLRKIDEAIAACDAAMKIASSIVEEVDDSAPHLRAELLQEMREALEFYKAGFRFHPKRTSTCVNLSTWEPTAALLEDCGNRAMNALAKLKEAGL